MCSIGRRAPGSEELVRRCLLDGGMDFSEQTFFRGVSSLAPAPNLLVELDGRFHQPPRSHDQQGQADCKQPQVRQPRRADARLTLERQTHAPSSAGARLRFLDIDEDEVSDLLAFLDALTDWDFVCDERFSDPFGNIPMHARCAGAD